MTDNRIHVSRCDKNHPLYVSGNELILGVSDGHGDWSNTYITLTRDGTEQLIDRLRESLDAE